MVGPSKFYAPSEASAFAWIRAHHALSKAETPQHAGGDQPQPTSTAEDDFLSTLHHYPLFTHISSEGRTISPPLFALRPPPAPQKSSFVLSYGAVEFAPPLQTPTQSNSLLDDDQDDDPALALADFSYQFAQWSADNTSASARTNENENRQRQRQRQRQETEILRYNNTELGHRIAVKDAIQGGLVDNGNTQQLVQLMHLLAGTTDTNVKNDGMEIEKGGQKGSVVLDEVSDDGKVLEDGEGKDGVDGAEKENEEPFKTGRLKGMARMEARKKGKK